MHVKITTGTWVVVDEVQRLPNLMFPLVPEELGEDFLLDRALEVGSLPLVLASESPHDTLRAYVQLYLREEIKGEALVRNLPGFARFLPVAGLFHGQLLNLSGIARDAGVARTTIEGYLEVLEDTEELCAVEVKAAARVHPGDLVGLQAVGELPQVRRRILVHRGERPTRSEDGIEIWPVETFLEALATDRLWSK